VTVLTQAVEVRHDWTKEQANQLFEAPFLDLLYHAHTIHRACFRAGEVQISRLLSIKTGACPEDCGYCSQSAHHSTGLEKETLMRVQEVIDAAGQAKAEGATRFCMGAAWRGPNEKDLTTALAMIEGVKALGLETCASFGLLDKEQAKELKNAGLDYYNHNLDTSPEHYSEVIGTRTFQDRLDTLENVREAGMHICSGGIVGLGEGNHDRASMLVSLANLSPHPESVPINLLMPIAGTPLADVTPPDPFDFIRTIAVARIMMPHSMVRLSAGRDGMNDQMQALCFFAGANSVFCGEKLLTAGNPSPQADRSLFDRLGLRPMPLAPQQ
jgi:biotin synthase